MSEKSCAALTILRTKKKRKFLRFVNCGTKHDVSRVRRMKNGTLRVLFYTNLIRKIIQFQRRN